MIDNNEIKARFFSTTASVAFDVAQNIDEIDELLKTFKEWEMKGIEKKK